MCSNCNMETGSFRCRDCFGRQFWCSDCCVSAHQHTPFHRVQQWNGKFFESSDLLERKLILHLRHFSDGCLSMTVNNDTMDDDDDILDEEEDFDDEWRTDHLTEAAAAFGSSSNLIIVSSTGIFKRSIRWCHCVKSQKQWKERVEILLQASLYPASFKNPKTVFTFEVLDHFRVDALECKTAAMNFMNKIGRITNEAFPSQVPVSVD